MNISPSIYIKDIIFFAIQSFSVPGTSTDIAYTEHLFYLI